MEAGLYYLNGGERRYGRHPVALHTRKYWEFQTVLSGRIAPVLGDGPLEPMARSLWIFASGHLHGWTGEDEEKAEILVYHLSEPDTVLQRLVSTAGGFLTVPLTETDIVWLRQRHGELTAEWARPTEVSHLKVTRLLTGLTLLALERTGYQPRLRTRDLYAERVERALYWYRQNLQEHPSVREVAEAVGVSEVHLRRLFRTARGESPKAAFQRIRMEQVRDALRDRQWTVEAVASRYGYADASSLSRAYRGHFGSTPRDAAR
ncbi:MAG: helix-turn-helix domain-containing protein [Oceanipulchritudo sp.]